MPERSPLAIPPNFTPVLQVPQPEFESILQCVTTIHDLDEQTSRPGDRR
jgi:hypothetical protein